VTAFELARMVISRWRPGSPDILKRGKAKKTSATPMQAIVLIAAVLVLFGLAFALTLWLRPN